MADNREKLIHQLYQEVVGVSEEEKDSRYIRSTGTLFGDPERFEREREERLQKMKEAEENPWNKLDLKPTDLR